MEKQSNPKVMNLYKKQKHRKEKICKLLFSHFIKKAIVVLSTLVSPSLSPDEGSLKPKRFNVDFLSYYIHHF